MFDTNGLPISFTPEQTAKILQLSKNTVYQLINSGEIIAKKYGKAYRISPKALSYIYTGLDQDLYVAEQEDLQNLPKINEALKFARTNAS